MRRGQFCIGVLDLTHPEKPMRYLRRGLGLGQLRLTDDAPTFGKEGNESMERQILYFHTLSDLRFYMRGLTMPPGCRLIPVGAGGPISPTRKGSKS